MGADGSRLQCGGDSGGGGRLSDCRIGNDASGSFWPQTRNAKAKGGMKWLKKSNYHLESDPPRFFL
jgi:hypothetical protein